MVFNGRIEREERERRRLGCSRALEKGGGVFIEDLLGFGKP